MNTFENTKEPHQLRTEIEQLLHFNGYEEPVMMTAIMRADSNFTELYFDEDTIPNTTIFDVVACGVTADGLAIAIQTEMGK